jgi:hypothetical protein
MGLCLMRTRCLAARAPFHAPAVPARVPQSRHGGISARRGRRRRSVSDFSLRWRHACAHQIKFDSSFRRIGVAAIFQEIAAAADRRRILQRIFSPILVTRLFTHGPFSSANCSHNRSSTRALRHFPSASASSRLTRSDSCLLKWKTQSFVAGVSRSF